MAMTVLKAKQPNKKKNKRKEKKTKEKGCKNVDINVKFCVQVHVHFPKRMWKTKHVQ